MANRSRYFCFHPAEPFKKIIEGHHVVVKTAASHAKD